MTKYQDLGVGIGAMIFGGVALAMTSDMPVRARFFPRLVTGLIIFFAACVCLASVYRMVSDRKSGISETKVVNKKQVMYKNVFAVLVILSAYYFLFQIVGYIIPTILLIASTALVLGYRNWKVMTITSICIAVVLYLTFTTVFGTRFPGIFF